jgi:CRP-like cAMP-binding protein
MGGMALQLERTIRVGDWIRIDAVVGIVTEIRWRQTSIETRDWDTVVVPNSVLMKSNVVILGRRRGHPVRQRRWVYFNVDFRHPPTDVITAVERALRDENIPGCAHDPPPSCLLSDFADSYAKYVVWYWAIDLHKVDRIDSVIRSRVWFGLQRAGISLSMPAARMFNVNDDDARKDRKNRDEHARRVAALKCVSLFNPLTDPERDELAIHLQTTPFAAGEHITRQGALADWMYILTSGQAQVQLNVDGHDTGKVLATIHPGDFVGEMGLMTGAPRSATVTAVADCFCYRLDKTGLDAILHRRPEIAASIAELLAARRVALDAARENLSEEAKRLRLKSAQGDLLQRMKSFFRL